MADDQTLQFYANTARTYAEKTNYQPGEQLRSFVAALPTRAEVLELGTGGGHDAAFMVAQGLRVSPTYASVALAAEAERRLGQAVTIMAFSALEAVLRYDGVWANASLLHAPKAELTGDLARIHRALRPGGLLVASFKAGDGEGRDRYGRYYNYPDRSELEAHFRAAGNWSELGIAALPGTGYDKLPTTWLWVSART